LQFVYRIAKRDSRCEVYRRAKRDPTPHCENVDKFVKYLKGTWLNGRVQIEKRN